MTIVTWLECRILARPILTPIVSLEDYAFSPRWSALTGRPRAPSGPLLFSLPQNGPPCSAKGATHAEANTQPWLATEFLGKSFTRGCWPFPTVVAGFENTAAGFDFHTGRF